MNRKRKLPVIIFVILLIGIAAVCAACGKDADRGLSDEEYLTGRGRALKRGMTVEDVIGRLGEPDEYVGINGINENTLTAPFLIYWRGEYRLFVRFRKLELTADYIILYHWIDDDNMEMIFHEALSE